MKTTLTGSIPVLLSTGKARFISHHKTVKTMDINLNELYEPFTGKIWVNIDTVTSYDGVRVFYLDQDEFYLGADVWRKLRREGKIYTNRKGDVFMDDAVFSEFQESEVR